MGAERNGFKQPFGWGGTGPRCRRVGLSWRIRPGERREDGPKNHSPAGRSRAAGAGSRLGTANRAEEYDDTIPFTGCTPSPAGSEPNPSGSRANGAGKGPNHSGNPSLSAGGSPGRPEPACVRFLSVRKTLQPSAQRRSNAHMQAGDFAQTGRPRPSGEWLVIPGNYSELIPHLSR
jgi:hypothetical protein